MLDVGRMMRPQETESTRLVRIIGVWMLPNAKHLTRNWRSELIRCKIKWKITRKWLLNGQIDFSKWNAECQSLNFWIDLDHLWIPILLYRRRQNAGLKAETRHTQPFIDSRYAWYPVSLCRCLPHTHMGTKWNVLQIYRSIDWFNSKSALSNEEKELSFDSIQRQRKSEFECAPFTASSLSLSLSLSLSNITPSSTLKTEIEEKEKKFCVDSYSTFYDGLVHVFMSVAPHQIVFYLSFFPFLFVSGDRNTKWQWPKREAKILSESNRIE